MTDTPDEIDASDLGPGWRILVWQDSNTALWYSLAEVERWRAILCKRPTASAKSCRSGFAPYTPSPLVACRRLARSRSMKQ